MSLTNFKLKSLKDKLNEQAMAEAKRLAEKATAIPKEGKVEKKPKK